MKKFLLLLNCLFLCLAAQAQCNMQGYSRQMAKADSCIKASNYKMAQEHYNAAKIYCDTKSDEVDVAKDKLFESIDKLRKEADQQRQIAQTALQKAQKLIDAFYFYEDKFALAYGKLDLNNVFYFIDKNGDEITKLGQWTKAEQFNDVGFAKVENLYCPKCVLDTSGNTYTVAY